MSESATIEKVVIGDATLYRADCMDVLPTLMPVPNIAIVTDPPYGIVGQDGKVQMRGDVIVSPDYGDWDLIWNPEWFHGLPGNASIIFHDQKMSTALVEEMEKDNWRLKRFIFWDKGDGGLNPRRNFVNAVEVCCFFTKGQYIWNGGASTTNIFRLQRRPTPNHPTEKPIKLITELCRLISDKGDTILDPFMGSGTCGVAALKLGRKFIGVEIEKKYFDIAVERISKENNQLKMFQGDK